MLQTTNNAIALHACDCEIFTADQLTEGDIIKNSTGDTWQVISEPESTNQGIAFEVMWLDVATPDNTQSVCFAPDIKSDGITVV